MSHTPGPWTWTEHFQGLRGGAVTEDSDDGMVLPFAAHEGMWIRDYTDEGKANARLIAAAPELLDALRDLLRDEALLDDDDPKLIATRTRAYAAVNKAEGK